MKLFIPGKYPILYRKLEIFQYNIRKINLRLAHSRLFKLKLISHMVSHVISHMISHIISHMISHITSHMISHS